MIGLFKQKNPGNALILLIYALVLKFPMFLHPSAPDRNGNYLYRLLLNGLDTISQKNMFFYSVLAFLLLFSQATLFNRIFNHLKLLAKPNYLAGMSYILVTSLLPDWNHFSAPLLINSLLIWIWYRMVSLYNVQFPLSSVFNIGLLTGIVTLIYLPAVAFLILMFFALLIMRPFRVREWVMSLVGFTSPYYFLLIFLYLTNQLSWKNILPSIDFAVPGIPRSIWITAGIVLLFVPFMIGGFFVQNNLNKLLIQVRKSWSLLLVFLLVSVIVILINRGASYETWFLTAVPFAAFHASAYYYPQSKALPLILHWITAGFIIALNYST